MSNEAYVKDIANTLELIHDGLLFICEDCGECYAHDQLDVDEDGMLLCPKCGTGCGEIREMNWGDYFDSALDIEYRVESRHADTLRSVKICVALGGPNVYVDTADHKVKLYWWADYAEAEFPADVADSICEFFEELWNCS